MNAYTYLVGWSKHGKFYYGAQWNKKANPDDLWTKYFTSSRHVKKFLDEHGDPDIVQVRKTFGDNATACREWEERFLTRIRRRHIGQWLNVRATSNKWFAPEGTVGAIALSTGKKLRVSLEEFDRNPDYVGLTTGMVTAINKTSGERLFVTKEEYAANPDLEHHMNGYTPSEEIRKAASERMTGKVFAKDESGNVVHVTMDEFAAREDLIGAGTGYTQSEDARRKIAASKIGKPRPPSVGEAVGAASTGMVAALNKITGIVSRVSREEFESNPNLVGASRGRVIPDDENGRRAAAMKGATAGMITCRDIRTGEKRKVPRAVFETDPYLVGMRSRVPNLT